MIINGKRFTGLQAFKEKNKQDYLLVDLDSSKHHPQGHLEALCTAIDGNHTSITISSISWGFLEEKCTETTWKKIPKEWQDTFLTRLEFPEKFIKNSTNPEHTSTQMKLF